MNYLENTPEVALHTLAVGNKAYIDARHNCADISPQIRAKTATEGQKPYAVVLTCSDSRVPPEHIFSAGIGDLFVVRTAGNVVGKFELGSIEYGVEHLGAKLVLVLGHTHCGAIAAALGGHAEGNIGEIVSEIQIGIGNTTDECEAILKNIIQSKNRIMQSPVIKELVKEKQIEVMCARYDICTGKVDFLGY